MFVGCASYPNGCFLPLDFTLSTCQMGEASPRAVNHSVSRNRRSRQKLPCTWGLRGLLCSGTGSFGRCAGQKSPDCAEAGVNACEEARHLEEERLLGGGRLSRSLRL